MSPLNPGHVGLGWTGGTFGGPSPAKGAWFVGVTEEGREAGRERAARQPSS